MNIALFNRENIDTCPWPDTDEGRYAQAALTPLIKNGVSSYIRNVKTQLYVLICDSLVIPVSVNDAEYDNAHVCSPYSYFISFAEQSLDFIRSYPLRLSFKGVIYALKKLARWGELNKVVLVNNWFFAINVYPKTTEEQVQHICHFLAQRFPSHALVFRSVDSRTNPVCFQALKKCAFSYIAAKQIFYLQEPFSLKKDRFASELISQSEEKHKSFFDSRLYKSDLRLLEKSGYEVVHGKDLSKEDMPRLLELYNYLYIEKYSLLNPELSESFIQLMWKESLFTFLAIKKEGRIDGVVGYLVRNGIMYCPFFGYDTSLPKEEGLYRILSTLLMKEVEREGYFFHQSSGASTYKKMRKAESSLEYTAVLHRHLSLRRRLPWNFIAQLYNRFGIKYMMEY